MEKDDKKNKTGMYIQKLREARKMTQRQLEEKSGISYRSIQNYEYSVRKPKDDAIKRIAEALDVPKEALYNEKDFLKAYESIVTSTSSVIRSTIDNKDGHKELASKEFVSGICLFSLGTWLVTGMFLPVAIVFTGLLTSLTAASKALDKKNTLLKLYKARAGVELSKVKLNDILEIEREEYEPLAKKVELAIKEQEDVGISENEYKEFIKRSKKMTTLQSYQTLLKNKSELVLSIIDQIENKSKLNLDSIKLSVSRIEEIEKREKELNDLLFSDKNEE